MRDRVTRARRRSCLVEIGCLALLAIAASTACGERRATRNTAPTPPPARLPAATADLSELPAALGDLARTLRAANPRAYACFFVGGELVGQLRRRARIGRGGTSFEVGWTCDERELIPLIVARGRYLAIDDYGPDGLLEATTSRYNPPESLQLGVLYATYGVATRGSRVLKADNFKNEPSIVVLGIPIKQGMDPFEHLNGMRRREDVSQRFFDCTIEQRDEAHDALTTMIRPDSKRSTRVSLGGPPAACS
ncbi:MAG TPA: hypothetical protein VN253_03145 [Kofleriaceae bacterium]|nr:hypothetical protein [Kofleriaceae bacterium]